jgi:hypothetical protein
VARVTALTKAYNQGRFIYFAFLSIRKLTWLGLQISLLAFALSLGVSGVLTLSPLPLLLNLVLGIMLYGAGALLIGVIRRDELERLWRLMGSYLPSAHADTI